MANMLQSTLSHFRDLREYLTPVSHVSSFRKTGEVTPDEFVTAGDYLVYKFPTWQWASAPPGKRRDFLPQDKQFLVTKHVPCYVRASTFEITGDDDELVEQDWVSANQEGIKREGKPPIRDRAGPADPSETPEIGEIEISDDDDEQVLHTVKPSRSYNLYIAYSTSYRVPKMYLSGFDAEGAPLSPQAMFEDIVSEYRNKTVTIERAPFLNDLTVVSIHPCRHATVMRVLLDRADARMMAANDLDVEVTPQLARVGLADNSGDGDDLDETWQDVAPQDQGIRVDQYLVIFLKFIASVTPGIEHDYTMSI